MKQFIVKITFKDAFNDKSRLKLLALLSTFADSNIKYV